MKTLDQVVEEWAALIFDSMRGSSHHTFHKCSPTVQEEYRRAARRVLSQRHVRIKNQRDAPTH